MWRALKVVLEFMFTQVPESKKQSNLTHTFLLMRKQTLIGCTQRNDTNNNH